MTITNIAVFLFLLLQAVPANEAFVARGTVCFSTRSTGTSRSTSTTGSTCAAGYYSSLSRRIHSVDESGSNLERPENAFSGIVNGLNGDKRWYRYNKLEPDAETPFHRVHSLRSRSFHHAITAP